MAKQASSSSSSSTAAPAVKKAKVTTKAVVTQKPTTSGKKNVKVESKASTNKANSTKVQASKANKAKTVKKKWTKPLMKDVYDFELKEYTVERIMDKHIKVDGIVKYFVKWLHYPEGKNTWQSVHDLANSMKHVLKWEREHGQNWQPRSLQSEDFNIMRDAEIVIEYDRLTAPEFRIKEKFGSAHGHSWYRVQSEKTSLEQVLCLKDDDPYYLRLNYEESQLVDGPGVWDEEPKDKKSA